ncbi:MAG: hypothetical protein K2M14_04720 [Muribaculaceae bacterium]|nr:hypothetical protein [Muribaculaceae bacterium]
MKNTFTILAAAALALSASAAELPINVSPASGSTLESVSEITLTSADDAHPNVWVGNFMLTVEKDDEKISDHSLSVAGDNVANSVTLNVTPAITVPGTYTLSLSRFSYFIEDVEGNDVVTPDSDLVLTYTVAEPLAVRSIDMESASKPVYFNLQGMRIDNPAPGQMVIMKQNNHTSKIIF